MVATNLWFIEFSYESCAETLLRTLRQTHAARQREANNLFLFVLIANVWSLSKNFHIFLPPQTVYTLRNAELWRSTKRTYLLLATFNPLSLAPVVRLLQLIPVYAINHRFSLGSLSRYLFYSTAKTKCESEFFLSSFSFGGENSLSTSRTICIHNRLISTHTRRGFLASANIVTREHHREVQTLYVHEIAIFLHREYVRIILWTFNKSPGYDSNVFSKWTFQVHMN